MSLLGCQTSPKPEPAPCGLVHAELMEYTKRYLHVVSENGILRKQLEEANSR